MMQFVTSLYETIVSMLPMLNTTSDDELTILETSETPLIVEAIEPSTDDSCDDFVSFTDEETSQDEDQVNDLVAELVADEAVERAEEYVYVPGNLIAEAFNTVHIAPTASETESISAMLSNGATNALKMVKDYAVVCAAAVVLFVVQWTLWYLGLWIEEYLKRLIQEALDAIDIAPTGEPGSISTMLSNGAMNALTIAKEYAITWGVPMAVSVVKWTLWYMGLWVMDYVKLLIQAEYERQVIEWKDTMKTPWPVRWW